jgi:hypothetical protein
MWTLGKKKKRKEKVNFANHVSYFSNSRFLKIVAQYKELRQKMKRMKFKNSMTTGWALVAHTYKS